jgi:phosphatidylglycerophosphatase A
VAIPVAGVAEKHYGKKDDGRIVVDEYLTFPICMLGLPWLAHPSLLAVGFVVNRVMDIVKIPPARQSQRLPGGWGIVVDDAIACLYALALNHLFYRFVLLRWA